ncbi:MAG: TonB-dependent receptor plug domain-containing protein, partial [Magnetococcus sp. WYHC-3]
MMRVLSLMFSTRRCMVVSLALWALLARSPLAVAELSRVPEGDGGVDQLMDLELEELLELEVTSASLKTQRLMDVASSVYVIDNAEIRRSGARSLPELLRQVPGLQVAQLDASRWAVSARGFNGRYARKLLVLIDGRSVYNPTFSGVYWDAQDLVLEDVERIEVIRGPGATIWGSNAMNGVINIITRSAQQTTGTLLKAGAGNTRHWGGTARHGGPLGGATHYRVYAQGFEEGSTRQPLLDAETWDRWSSGRAGFRLDSAPAARDVVTFTGEVSANRNRSVIQVLDLNTLTTTPDQDAQDVQGAHMLGRWVHHQESGGTLSVQGYVDHYRRDATLWFDEEVTTLDLEAHHLLSLPRGQQLVYGANLRWISHGSGDNDSRIRIIPAEADEWSYSAFVQDEVALSPERWFL